MFFQTPESATAVQTALNVVVALVPAFAMGFAIQRMLEIVDSWISLDGKVGAEWKAALLNGMSLVVGIALAVAMKLKILLVLGFTTFDVLDYLISGLIISAGTDGLNSIVKFLSYAKDVKKAQAVTERETAFSVRETSLRRTFMFSALAGDEGVPSGDPEKDLSTVLHDQIKATWPGKFVEKDWTKRKFGVFESTADRAKIVIRAAVLIVASAYDKTISNDAIVRLQDLVTNDTTPEKMLPEMLVCVLRGTP